MIEGRNGEGKTVKKGPETEKERENERSGMCPASKARPNSDHMYGKEKVVDTRGERLKGGGR